MRCPQCQQEVGELRGEACPYCGFLCGEFHRRVTQIQVVLFALFASTLLYGSIAAVLELVADYQAPVPVTMEPTLGTALAGVTAAVFVISLVFEGRGLEQATLDAYTRTVIILGAMAEVPAILGLVMFLVIGSLPWMVGFMAVSWALFIRLGLKLPQILRGITECLRTG